MPYTVGDITMNADRFREAYPNWPHAEADPGPAAEAEPEREAEAG